MKIGNYEVDIKWILLGLVAILTIAGIIYASIPDPKPVDTTAIINNAVAVATKPLLDQIEVNKASLAEIQIQIAASEDRINVLNKKYIILERRKNDVVQPVTDKETRDRFTAAGFVPLPVPLPIK